MPADGLALLGSRGHFKNAYELLNLRALKISMLYKNRIFQCMGKIFCVEFQRVPLKFHTIYLTHTKYLTHKLKDVDFIHRWKFKSSKDLRAHKCFWNAPQDIHRKKIWQSKHISPHFRHQYSIVVEDSIHLQEHNSLPLTRCPLGNFNEISNK